MNRIRGAVLGLGVVAALASCKPSEPTVENVHEVWAERIFLAGQNKRSIAPLTAEREIGVDEAYLIQAEYNAAMRQSFGETSGYKIAYASKASQKKWNIDAPTFGTFFKRQEVENGGSVNEADFILFHIEAEVAFTIAEDIREPVGSVADLMPKIELVHVGLDVPDNRFDSSKGPVKVADVIAMSCGTHSYVLGQGVDPQGLDFEGMTISLEHDGKVVYKGASSNVLGDPREAVILLIRHLLLQGSYLKKGDVVLSGSVAAAYCPETNAERRGSYVGKVSGLPSVSLTVE